MEDFHYTTRALSNPAILQRILSFLWMSSAARAARVSRLWFTLSIDQLWRYASIGQLGHVEAGRRQVYASRLQHLSLQSNDDISIAKGLQFPKVQAVDFDEDSSSTDCASYEPFKSCPVSELTICAFTVPDAFLELMAEWWPKICHVEIIDLPASNDMTPEGLLNFVSSLASLKFLNVSGHEVNIQAEGLLPHCATRTELSSLRLPLEIPFEAVKRATSHHTKIFGSLKEVELTLPSEGFALMLGALQNLTILQLELTSVTIPILSSISSLTALKELTVIFPSNYEIPRSEIMSLRSLSKMQRLLLSHNDSQGSVYEVEDVAQLDFVDGDFEQLLTHFPDLYALELSCESTLSARALVCLADHCPSLGSFMLPSDIDLRRLQLDTRTTAAFPRLWALHVESLSFSHATQDQDSLARLFEKHFPKLTDFTVEDKTRGYRKIASSLKSVVRKHREKAHDEVAEDLCIERRPITWYGDGNITDDDDDDVDGFEEEAEEDWSFSEEELVGYLAG
ncbi:hypothetical protein MY11210_004451 [Beauveria gryllotalpidicola]